LSRPTGLTNSMRRMFDTMLERTPTTEAYDPKAYDDGSDVHPCPPSKYQVLNIGDSNLAIKDFCAKGKLTFKAGKGFYEFTKPESISAKKLIVLMKRTTGDLYEGPAARRIACIGSSDKKLKPSDLADYRVFIQSTSHNRVLQANTGFLYEADDFGRS